jgi:hypothetical protein
MLLAIAPLEVRVLHKVVVVEDALSAESLEADSEIGGGSGSRLT